MHSSLNLVLLIHFSTSSYLPQSNTTFQGFKVLFVIYSIIQNIISSEKLNSETINVTFLTFFSRFFLTVKSYKPDEHI